MASRANELANAIRDLLTLHGWMPVKLGTGCATNSRGQFYRLGQPGTPDLIAWKPRAAGGTHLLCLEVKIARDVISDAQTEFFRKATAHGATCLIAHSCQDVEPLLEKLT